MIKQSPAFKRSRAYRMRNQKIAHAIRSQGQQNVQMSLQITTNAVGKFWTYTEVEHA